MRNLTYFRTARWVFDPAARRRASRAHDILGGAHDYLSNTAVWDDIDIDLASWDALALVDGARKRVDEAEVAAHRAAR